MVKTGYHYRCSREACKARHTFPRMLEEYQRRPKCRVCGGVRFRLDAHREQHGPSEGRKTCKCDGYHHPHRRGAGVWCRHHPTGPTDDDYRDRYGETDDV